MSDVIVRVVDGRAVVKFSGPEAIAAMLAQAGTAATSAAAAQVAAEAAVAGFMTPAAFGAVGNGIADDTTALVAAAASGVEVNLQGKTYKVSNKAILASGTIFRGPGRLVPTSSFAGQWVLEVAAGAATQIKDVTIDGAAILATNIVYGIRANGSTTDLLISGCTIKNLTFTGIDVSDGGGSLTHARLRVTDNHVENVGWVGINVENSIAAKIRGNDVVRTGYHGIATNKGCDDAVVSENYVSKATAPTSIFNGLPGGVEGGFMITYEPTVERLVITANVLDDNRHAAYDGIGVGEDGTEFGSVVITNNIIHRAGLFGIDPTGNAVVDGNMVTESAEQGIHVGLDLGGIIRNVVVTDNMIRNTGDVAGKSGILVGDTLGAAVAMSHIKIADNVVTDDRTTKYTSYGITIVSEEATFTGLSVTGNDLASVATASFSYVGAAGPGADFQCWGNATKGDELQTMVPTLTPGSGAITTSTRSCRFQRIGDMVDFSMRIQIAAHGTGAGTLTASLPVPARAGVSIPVTGVAGNTSDTVYALLGSGGLVIAQDDGGATVIVDGADIYLQGRYEAA